MTRVRGCDARFIRGLPGPQRGRGARPTSAGGAHAGQDRSTVGGQRCHEHGGTRKRRCRCGTIVLSRYRRPRLIENRLVQVQRVEGLQRDACTLRCARVEGQGRWSDGKAGALIPVAAEQQVGDAAGAAARKRLRNTSGTRQHADDGVIGEIEPRVDTGGGCHSLLCRASHALIDAERPDR